MHCYNRLQETAWYCAFNILVWHYSRLASYYAVTHLDAFLSREAFSSWVTLKQKTWLKLTERCCKYIITVSCIDGNFWMHPDDEKEETPAAMRVKRHKNITVCHKALQNNSGSIKWNAFKCVWLRSKVNSWRWEKAHSFHCFRSVIQLWIKSKRCPVSPYWQTTDNVDLQILFPWLLWIKFFCVCMYSLFDWL